MNNSNLQILLVTNRHSHLVTSVSFGYEKAGVTLTATDTGSGALLGGSLTYLSYPALKARYTGDDSNLGYPVPQGEWSGLMQQFRTEILNKVAANFLEGKPFVIDVRALENETMVPLTPDDELFVPAINLAIEPRA